MPSDSLGEHVASLPILDHHAHGLFPEAPWRAEPIEPYFTESADPDILARHVPHNLYFRRSIRQLAELYGCDPTPDAVREARQAQDYPALCARLMRETGITLLLMDDGIWPDRLLTVGQMNTLLPTRRVARIETEAAGLLREVPDARAYLKRVEAHFDALAPGLVALKSIAAYRTGLDVKRPEWPDVQRDLDALLRETPPDRTPRLNRKALLDATLHAALRAGLRHGLPVQFHTGYGDPDLDLRLANPLHLRALLEDPELRGLNVVMLHCYPFVREAGYLASVYPGAWLDVGLTIPYTSTHGMVTAWHESLHLTPVTKVLFSTDAQRTPEMYWLAARAGRTTLTRALGETVEAGDLSPGEARWAARRLLHDNAAELYRTG
ncbi:hydrolase (plasmid) [Deinococcus aetherius]|uniref:Hydrolase n=1 Tax=Deinococcus aetherius TaxID=200252 RepID=A0ABM8AJR2_9DEIO|nr:amidohydrolase family protein [Deinococcus aetherius]BDP44064.1 hydrolase [Deinococcus aetherius]